VEETVDVKLARIEERLEVLIKKLDSIEDDFVKVADFNPVRNVVYGMVGLILVSVIGALLNLIFAK
jgi:hypothetical protein